MNYENNSLRDSEQGGIMLGTLVLVVPGSCQFSDIILTNLHVNRFSVSLKLTELPKFRGILLKEENMVSHISSSLYGKPSQEKKNGNSF